MVFVSRCKICDKEEDSSNLHTCDNCGLKICSSCSEYEMSEEALVFCPQCYEENNPSKVCDCCGKIAENLVYCQGCNRMICSHCESKDDSFGVLCLECICGLTY